MGKSHIIRYTNSPQPSPTRSKSSAHFFMAPNCTKEIQRMAILQWVSSKKTRLVWPPCGSLGHMRAHLNTNLEPQIFSSLLELRHTNETSLSMTRKCPPPIRDQASWPGDVMAINARTSSVMTIMILSLPMILLARNTTELLSIFSLISRNSPCDS